MDNKKIIVTGSSGFIGSNFIKKINSTYKNVDIICIDDFSTGTNKDIYDYENVKLLKVDISTLYNNSLTENITNQCENAYAIFHFAARARVQPSIINPNLFNSVNVTGTLNLLEICKNANVQNFIFSSSSSIYGNTSIYPTPETIEGCPLSPYGLQKQIGEQYCQLYSRIHNLKTVCLRYFNVYGPGMPTEGPYNLLIGIYTKLKSDGKPLVIYGDGNQRRDFTHVDDVIQGNILAATNNNIKPGSIFNIGRGSNVSVKSIAETFGGPIEYLPPRVEPKQTLADNNKARNLLGWTPKYNVLDWLKGYLKS